MQRDFSNARGDSYVRVESVSEDGEHVIEIVPRGEFEVPPTWREVWTQGIYGRYACGGTDTQPVTWEIEVMRG